MSRETLFTLVTNGIILRPVLRNPLLPSRLMLGVSQASRYSGSKPSMQITTTVLGIAIPSLFTQWAKTNARDQSTVLTPTILAGYLHGPTRCPTPLG